MRVALYGAAGGEVAAAKIAQQFGLKARLSNEGETLEI